MAIPERLSRNGGGTQPSPESTEDDTFEKVSIDDQLADALSEDADDDDYGSFEAELVGGSSSDEADEDDSDSLTSSSPKRAHSEPDDAATKKSAPKRSADKTSHVSSNGKASRLPTKEKSKGKSKNGPMIEIDPKTKKLLPFGSSRKTLRTNDFEPRKNVRREQTIARFAALGLLLAIVIVAVYQAVFPAKPLTEKQVYSIALQATNYTNFPVESARGFATDFMRAYLTVDPDSPSDDVLGYYYTGALGESSGSSSSSSSTRTATGSYNQKVLYGPTVYSARGITDTTGSYTIAALVQPEKVTNSDTNETTTSPPRWQFFNVNVYYNESKQAFSIAPDSPSVIPAAEVESPDDAPKPAPLGTGEASDELKDSTSSVVNGFIQGYMTTTPSDHSALDQYIVSNPDPSLTKGLGGQYTLADSSNAISYEAFPVEDSNEVKVRVQVTWVSSPDGKSDSESRAQFTSTYVMTLQGQGDGRYLVSKFAPEYYVPDPSDS